MNASEVQARLDSEVARELLAATLPARLSFVAPGGEPHVTPIWFLWRAGAIVMCSRADTFKVRCIERQPRVAISIDRETPPYKVLRVRGRAEISRIPTAGKALPEYEECAHRYYGREIGDRWLTAVTSQPTEWARISVVPDWVEAADFEQRFPWLYG